jgi:two-component system, cell cycle sensor histidine kinase and response regulator CckA
MATVPLRALIIEDSEDDCALLVRTLQQGGYEVAHQRVDSAEALLARLHAGHWDIVLSDHSMPGFSGTAALALVREKGLDIPFVFVSGTIGEEIAVNAMRVGAQDYIMKSNLKRLLPAIERELREAQVRREHKDIEQRMRQLEKFEAIGRLAGGIAHDFNNVIGAIMGWAELGEGEVPAGSRAEKFFQQIRNHSERAAGLTRQLLAYARRQILEPRNIDLNQVIGETSGLLEKLVGEQIHVEMKLARDLRAVRADRSQLEQVFINLCVNARDAMFNGGQLRIETCNVELDEEYCRRHVYGRPGSYVRLTVSDTGTGMDSATIERIFEPFFTTKEVGKGTGLGLATALGVVNQHGGAIEVASELGKGTSFYVYLPVSANALEVDLPPTETAVLGGTETILVADDHDGVREMTREILQKLGYRVILARNGEEAVKEFANSGEIALLLLDVIMPCLAGPDAYAKISHSKPGIPVIFTSGYSDEAAWISPLLEKGVVVLQKPYGPKVLARKIRELLDQTSKRNSLN